MLVFHAPTKVDYMIIRALAAFGLSIHVFDKNKVVKKNFFGVGDKVFNIEFLFEDTIGLIKFNNYIPKKNISTYLSSLHLNKCILAYQSFLRALICWIRN